MEKSEFLKVRVTERTKQDFDAICLKLGKPQTQQLRELVEEFVKQQYDRLEDRITVDIYKPDGYSFGAWRITIILRNPEEGTWHGKPIPFALPEMDQRRLESDKEHQTVVGIPDDVEFVRYALGGFFINGVWRGHLYSNGIAENDNPTSIEAVRQRLIDDISKLLDKFNPKNR